MRFNTMRWMSSVAGVLLAIAPAVRAEVNVYRCEVGGRVTYSDVACPTGSEVTRLSSRPTDADVAESKSIRHRDDPKSRSSSVAAHRAKSSIAEEQARHKERCKDLKTRLDAITNKLWREDSSHRKADQRERLRVQEADMQSKLRADKCH